MDVYEAAYLSIIGDHGVNEVSLQRQCLHLTFERRILTELYNDPSDYIPSSSGK